MLRDTVGDNGEHTLNPYIALADVCVSLILILAFVVATTVLLGKVGWDQVRYRDDKAAVAKAVVEELGDAAPWEDNGRRDPMGKQRWVFTQRGIFGPGTAVLTADGMRTLNSFAGVLRSEQKRWRRIFIEGHTMPPLGGEPDDWGLSAMRAAAVARVFYCNGHIPPHRLAVSARAGQAPRVEKEQDPRNERVEVVVEYENVSSPD